MTASTFGVGDEVLAGGVDRSRSARPAATSLADTSLASFTATTSAPETTSVSRRMWSRPIMPVPMTPTLSVMRSFSFVGGGQ